MEELRGSGNEFLRRVAREGDPGASVSMSVADLQHLFKRLDNAEQTAQDQKERCRNLLRQTASDQDIIDELEAKLTEARGHNTELRKKVDAQLTDRAPTAQQTLEFACAAHAKAIGTPVFEIEYGNRDNAIYHGAQRDVITMAAANLLGKWQRNGGGLANGPLEVQLARVWLTVFPLNPA